MLFARRIFLLLPVLLFSISGKAQLFSFADTSTTIIKNTNQSPAHWYLEITSNSFTDTTLRWKVHFEDIPAAWSINFDTQNQNWPVILDGDSSNFTLFYDPDFPQKLIIGAALNNTPGHGFVYFDIYNPVNPAEFQTITYEYIIGVAQLNALASLSWLEFSNTTLSIKDEVPSRIELVDELGRTLFTTFDGSCALSEGKPNFVRITRNQHIYFLTIFAN